MEIIRRCLMIGNSRWHWAEQHSKKWHFTHSAPDPYKLNHLDKPLFSWAAVGPIPSNATLDPNKQIKLKDIPLQKLPLWLGVDRAIGAWGAYRKAKEANLMHSGLLVADAGTVLSLTKITANGEFDGGQLIAGLRLQLGAMAQGTKDLNDPGLGTLTTNIFPFSTSEAMRRGSVQALVGSLIEAYKEAQLPIWLCGGDAPVLLEKLQERGVEVFYYPNLTMEGMVNLHNLPH